MPKEYSALETAIKQLIIKRYGKIARFCDEADIKQSTLSSVLERGLENAGLSAVQKICNTLQISIDSLADGEIVSKSPEPVEQLIEARITTKQQKLINAYDSHKDMQPAVDKLLDI